MSEQSKSGQSGMDSATLRSVLLGAGSVLVATVAIALYHPKPRTPVVPPAAVAIAAPTSPPAVAKEETPAPAQEASAAPETLTTAENTDASASVSPPPAEPAGATAALPQPAPKPSPAHPMRRVKRLMAHQVRPSAAPAPAPEEAAPEVPDAAPPAPPAEPPLPPLTVTIGVRRAQAGVLSKPVNLADLDLHTPDGACKALKRIRRAAEDVCPFDDGIGLGMMSERRKCVQETLNNTKENMRKARFELPEKGC